jgi:hypothetical protein
VDGNRQLKNEVPADHPSEIYTFKRDEFHVRASAQKEGHDRDSAVERNDAVHPMIGTIQRRNITHRRSQDRAQDRVSLEEPSIPVEMLLARKSHAREIDVEYKTEARTPTTPPLHQNSEVRIGTKTTSPKLVVNRARSTESKTQRGRVLKVAQLTNCRLGCKRCTLVNAYSPLFLHNEEQKPD